MEAPQNIQVIDRNVQPLIYNPAIQFVFRAVVEVVKVVAAKLFLEFLGRQFLNNASKVAPREVFVITVFAPVVEEILFRGILLRGIHSVQKGWNYLKGKELSEKDVKAQQIFRVHLSALIFAAAHLTNPHKTVTSALIQFSWSYFGGVTYAYLSEKYRTLSVNILAHGFNNCLAVAARIYPAECAPLFLLAILVNKVGAYLLAVSVTIDQHVATGVRQFTAFCISLPGRMGHWNRQENQPIAVPV
jgi:membrane protease YdiL (CAAX protease family)